MIPTFASFSLYVVATDTESKMTSTATPASAARSFIGTPSFSNVLQELRIDLIHALLLLGLGRRVIDDVLEVDLLVRDVRPSRFLHREPVAVGLQPELESHSGSFFFVEMSRMVSSFKPSAQSPTRCRCETVLVRLVDEIVEVRCS